MTTPNNSGQGSESGAAQGAVPNNGGGSQTPSSTPTADYVPKSEFVALQSQLATLIQKNEDVIKDNAKYRERFRAFAGDDATPGTGSQGAPSAESQRIEELERTITAQRFETAFSREAQARGARNADLLALTIQDVSSVMGNDGKLKDADGLFKELKTRYPDMFTSVADQADSGASGVPIKTAADVNRFIRTGKLK